MIDVNDPPFSIDEVLREEARKYFEDQLKYFLQRITYNDYAPIIYKEDYQKGDKLRPPLTTLSQQLFAEYCSKNKDDFSKNKKNFLTYGNVQNYLMRLMDFGRLTTDECIAVKRKIIQLHQPKTEKDKIIKQGKLIVAITIGSITLIVIALFILLYSKSSSMQTNPSEILTFTQSPNYKERALTKGPLDNLYGLELYEVSNERYKFCVIDRICSEPAKIAGVTYYQQGSEKLPVSGVDTSQARQFCNWLDRDLPTLAQWETAATQNKSTVWPWGNTPDPAYSNRVANLFYQQPPPEPLPVDAWQEGATGGKKDGIYNLIGNMREWTRTSPTGNDWLDTPNPPINLWVVGGGIDTGAANVIAVVKGKGETSKVSYESNVRTKNLGFRCSTR